VQLARSGEGPTLIECKTYRYYGHHQSDDTLRYRTTEEERTWRERDCLRIFREYVLAEKHLTESELLEIDIRNRAALDDAIAFAERSPLPEAAELYMDVYVS
jgi:pyruvate dehydrogenase E1 component alpha subunit